MAYIVLGVLREIRPVVFYVLAATLFVLSQLAYFLLSEVICKVNSTPWLLQFPVNKTLQGSKAKVDGSFLATLLETASVGALYLAWKNITEGEFTNQWMS